MTAHARLSPSDAARWLRCPGAIGFQERVGEEEEANPAASEGTFAHRIRQDALDTGLDAHDFVGHRSVVAGFEYVCTREMADYLQPGIDRLRDLGGSLYVEEKVSLARWCPDIWGTLDAGVVTADLIHIDDLKYGAGVLVAAEKNLQLAIYALGFWDQIARHQTQAEEFLIHIDQPRVAGSGSEWRVGLSDLLRFVPKLVAGVAATKQAGAPRSAGLAQCRWCRCRAQCPEYAEFNLAAMSMRFGDLDEEPPRLPARGSLTPEQRSRVLLHAEEIRRWIGELHNAALADALAGRPCPGLKAVWGRRPHRKWRDEREAEDFLLSRLTQKQAYTRELVSPALAEKLLGKTQYARAEALVNCGEPAKVLVPVEDKREAILPVAQMFDNLDGEDGSEPLVEAAMGFDDLD